MAKFDMKNDIKVSVAVAAAVASAGTAQGSVIDMNDAESLTLAIVADAGLTGNHNLLVEETVEDPNNPDQPLTASFATVDADFLIDGAAVATSGADAVKTVGYVGKKRFVRVSLVSDAGSTVPVGVTAIKGNLFDKPAA